MKITGIFLVLCLSTICEAYLPADLNFDHSVDFYDFATFADQWLSTEDSNEPNSIGVGAADYLIAASDSSARMKAKADYVCDGVADNVEIQAAIDALPDTGGRVFLAEGTFYIDDPIFPRDYVHLQGQGMYCTILKSTTNLKNMPIILRTETYWTPLERRTGPDNPSCGVHLSDFKVDGSDSWGKGIFFRYLQDAILERLFVYKACHTGMGNDFHRNVVYRNCRAEECGWRRYTYPDGSLCGCSGFGLGVGAWEDEFCTVSDCIARNNIHAGFTFESVKASGLPCQNFEFRSCISSGNYVGISIDARNNPASTGEKIRNSRVSVTNCWVFDNSTDGILLNGYNHEIIIANNFVAENGNCGIYLTSDRSARNILISNNIIRNNSQQGILLRTGNASVLGNQVFGNMLDGISLIADEADISDVILANNISWNNGVGRNDQDGIELCGSANYGLNRISVTGNKCYDSGGTPLAILTSVRDSNNLCTITTTLQYHYVTGDSVEIAGVTQADFNGMFIVTVTGLRTFTYTKAGPVGSSSGGTATRQPSQRYGISVVGGAAGLSNSFFTGNMLEGNETDALYSDNPAGNGNLITNNKGYVTDSFGTLTGTGSQQTIPHGLSSTPTVVLLSNIDDGANAYQSAAADATNIFITAVNGKDYHWLAMVK